MRRRSFVRMVEELNECCDRSLSIASYGGEWRLHSYREGTLFAPDVGGDVWGVRLLQVVEEAYRRMMKEKGGGMNVP